MPAPNVAVRDFIPQPDAAKLMSLNHLAMYGPQAYVPRPGKATLSRPLRDTNGLVL